MDNIENKLCELEASIGTDIFLEIQDRIADELKDYAFNDTLLTQIFTLMEKYPLLDWGMPGAIVHLLESCDNELYQNQLLSSIDRQPTMHTVWMLNRQINDLTDDKKNNCIHILQNISTNETLPAEIRKSAQSFFEYQTKPKSASTQSSGSNFNSLGDIFKAFGIFPKK